MRVTAQNAVPRPARLHSRQDFLFSLLHFRGARFVNRQYHSRRAEGVIVRKFRVKVQNLLFTPRVLGVSCGFEECIFVPDYDTKAAQVLSSGISLLEFGHPLLSRSSNCNYSWMNSAISTKFQKFCRENTQVVEILLTVSLFTREGGASTSTPHLRK